MAAEWKPIIHECRNHVPIIEGVNHLGAGLLVSSDGLIVTNAHVVDNTGTLMVSLHDGTRAKGVMIHRHERADLAIVRAAIHTRHYFPLQDRLAHGYDAGDEVLAIGHPRGLHFTSTRGIVSEASRRTPDGRFVQTDVAINPGNSGGPLIDAQGNLVGINTWQIGTDSQGLGFAIPGAQILEYFLEFSRLHRTGQVEIPTDEQLAELEQSLSPPELFEAAAELAELTIQRNEDIDADGWWWTVSTHAGNGFLAGVGKTFLITRHITDLTPAHQKDENLLFQLLRWQNEMAWCRFRVDENNELFLGYLRPFEDLDVSEACNALLEMSRAVDSFLPPLQEYVDTPQKKGWFR
jgi:hypothetical protein